MFALVIYLWAWCHKVLPHLLTYPRSGSHYFNDMLYKEAKINFNKSHYIDQLFDKNNNKMRIIITIARDPVETLTSYLALTAINERNHEYIVSERITEYVLMYSYLCNNVDYVIDFNDLIKYPKDLIEKLLNLLDIDKYHDKSFNRDVIAKYRGFISTSKTLAAYQKNILDGYNLDSCYFYYNKLLEKKIII